MSEFVGEILNCIKVFKVSTASGLRYAIKIYDNDEIILNDKPIIDSYPTQDEFLSLTDEEQIKAIDNVLKLEQYVVNFGNKVYIKINQAHNLYQMALDSGVPIGSSLEFWLAQKVAEYISTLPDIYIEQKAEEYYTTAFPDLSSEVYEKVYEKPMAEILPTKIKIDTKINYYELSDKEFDSMTDEEFEKF